MGSWNSLCIVTPPTLKAARPVGSATAHKSLEFHMLVSKIFIVSIMKDFPVPPTQLMNNLSGFRSLHEHLLFSWDLLCKR